MIKDLADIKRFHKNFTDLWNVWDVKRDWRPVSRKYAPARHSVAHPAMLTGLATTLPFSHVFERFSYLSNKIQLIIQYSVISRSSIILIPTSWHILVTYVEDVAIPRAYWPRFVCALK